MVAWTKCVLTGTWNSNDNNNDNNIDLIIVTSDYNSLVKF